jgi:NAD(P)-dependent dehydrogenase (short-subunit alcohol dehydrogenase family)
MRPDETRPDDPGAEPARSSRKEDERAAGPVPDATGSLADTTSEPGPEPAPPLPEPTPPPPVRPVPALEVIHPDDLDPDDDEDDEDDDEDEDEDDDDDEFDDVRTVLITGASGNMAQKLRAAWEDVYDLVLIDKVASHDDDVILADLAEFDEGWITHFHGVDTVIHLAGLPTARGTWEELERPNLDVLANVLHACALAGVERVIFASSSHVMGGYLDLGDMPITVKLPPKPDSPYGATKLMGERLGRSLARAFNITFIAIRLGWNGPGENRPDTLPDAAARAMWLSNGDLVRLMECAVEADLDDDQWVVVNGVSNNRGSRWDMTAAAEFLEFTPEDDAYDEEL